MGFVPLTKRTPEPALLVATLIAAFVPSNVSISDRIAESLSLSPVIVKVCVEEP
jgi:hypothetical protein